MYKWHTAWPMVDVQYMFVDLSWIKSLKKKRGELGRLMYREANLGLILEMNQQIYRLWLERDKFNSL